MMNVLTSAILIFMILFIFCLYFYVLNTLFPADVLVCTDIHTFKHKNTIAHTYTHTHTHTHIHTQLSSVEAFFLFWDNLYFCHADLVD